MERKFDPKKLEELQGQNYFDYYDNHASAGWFDSVSLFVKQWLQKLSKLLADQLDWNINPVVFEIIFYGVIVGGMVFLLFKLLDIDIKSILPFQSKKISTKSYKVVEEDLSTLDFEDLISKAKEEGNYVLAIRYRYLQVLHVLSEKGMIEYEMRKTNSQYSKELIRHPKHNDFMLMARSFEYIWYGKMKANVELYNEVDNSFKSIKGDLG